MKRNTRKAPVKAGARSGWPALLQLALLVPGGYLLAYGAVLALAWWLARWGLHLTEAVTAASMLGLPLYLLLLVGGWLMRPGWLFYLGFGLVPVLTLLALWSLGP